MKQRDPKRVGRILKKIGQVWKGNPDLRLVQLVVSALAFGGIDDDSYEDVYFAGDYDLEKGLDLLLDMSGMPNKQKKRNIAK